MNTYGVLTLKHFVVHIQIEVILCGIFMEYILVSDIENLRQLCLNTAYNLQYFQAM